MKRFVLPLALAVAVVGLAPRGVQAACSTPNVFNICVDFDLAESAGTWYLTTTYQTGSTPGKLTATGIYYNAGKTAPDFGIGDLNVDLADWQAGTGCGDLNLNNGSTDLLSACGSTQNGVNGALLPGDKVVVSFTANDAFTTAFNAGELDFRAHIQNYNGTQCSLKIDTGVQGNIGSAGTDCVPPGTVPEPITMSLLGTGLAGVGLLRRRRRNTEVVDD